MKKEKHPEVLLTTREINILGEVVAISEPAYNATLIMEESDALMSLVAPSITSLHQQWFAMSDDSMYCRSLAKALLDSLEARFSGLLANLRPVQTCSSSDGSESSQSQEYGTGPFGHLIYLVAASLDPDCRLAWLDEWQKKWDPSVKQRVTGKELNSHYLSHL